MENKTTTTHAVEHDLLTDSWFFPEHGVSVEADSLEQAMEKLDKTLKSNKEQS